MPWSNLNGPLDSRTTKSQKSIGPLCPGTEVIHRLITQWEEKAPITQLGRVLEVSRSGLCAARKRQTQPASICFDSVHVKAVFEASGRSCGS